MSFSLFKKIGLIFQLQQRNLLFTIKQRRFKTLVALPKNKLSYKFISAIRKHTDEFNSQKSRNVLIPFKNLNTQQVFQNALKLQIQQKQQFTSDPMLKKYEDASYIMCNRQGDVWIQQARKVLLNAVPQQMATQTKNSQSSYSKQIQKQQLDKQIHVEQFIIGAIDLSVDRQMLKSKLLQVEYFQSNKLYLITILSKFLILAFSAFYLGMLKYIALVYEEDSQFVREEIQKIKHKNRQSENQSI